MSDLREHIKKLRYDFSQNTLDEKDVDHDPLKQFEKWFKEAVDAKVNEPNAMTLATSGPYGHPSARIVLLRDFTPKGFSFYTNYNSKKGKDIEHIPFACLLFFWPELQRQVRLAGKLVKQSDKESDEYFSSRPRESQLGAWTSAQSEVLRNREELEKRLKETEKKFEGKEVPRPPFWGGYTLQPEEYEFWQGRPSRLHDRIRYSMDFEKWKIERLYP
ncbi:MAG TPA: pyridoxamine 5'-phosphate oxidase [Bacteroidia bacterium]